MKKSKAGWAAFCAWLPILITALVVAGVVALILWGSLGPVPVRPAGVVFKTVSLPRFEISIATLPDGSQVRVMFDRTAHKDYLTIISPQGGVSTVPLPYKNE